MVEDQDHDIIRRILQGQRDEFSVLVSRHQDMIFAMIMRQVGEMAAAKDLTQDSFVKAYHNLGRFRFEAKFSTWLTRIALNITNSYFSSRRYRTRKLEQEFKQEVHEMSTENNEDEADKEVLIASLREALGDLKPHFRDVMVLCGVEGRSYDEAAAILEIPVGTVRSRLNKARLLLKQAFGLAA